MQSISREVLQDVLGLKYTPAVNTQTVSGITATDTTTLTKHTQKLNRPMLLTTFVVVVVVVVSFAYFTNLHIITTTSKACDIFSSFPLFYPETVSTGLLKSNGAIPI